MHEEIFRALQEGATLITASRRLARVLTREFHSMEAARGRTVWNRPDVLPLDAYLDRTWGDWLGRWADESSPILLDALQEQMLWEQIIRESPEGASLLQIPETARQADGDLAADCGLSAAVWTGASKRRKIGRRLRLGRASFSDAAG